MTPALQALISEIAYTALKDPVIYEKIASEMGIAEAALDNVFTTLARLAREQGVPQ
tara:strand:+ start:943 stop:1110 length:168 start_codon:yes stop_codon:yes gene_type:complete